MASKPADMNVRPLSHQSHVSSTRGSSSASRSSSFNSMRASNTAANHTLPDQLQGLRLGPEAGKCQFLCCSPMRPPLQRKAESDDFSTSNKSQASPGTDGTREAQNEDGVGDLSALGEHVDVMTFEQILEMDDDEQEREFSRSIVYDFFAQAETTFERMNNELNDEDLESLSAAGHFLKGSSATLGLTKVKDSCEKIQHYGAMKDETGSHDEPDREKCLANCKKTIEQAKKDFTEAERRLKRFYGDDGI